MNDFAIIFSLYNWLDSQVIRYLAGSYLSKCCYTSLFSLLSLAERKSRYIGQNNNKHHLLYNFEQLTFKINWTSWPQTGLHDQAGMTAK